MAEVEITAQADASSLRGVLDMAKQFSPKLATELRRELRRSGDNIIRGQRDILDSPLPKGIEVADRVLKVARNKKTGKFYVAKRNVYAERDVSMPGRSTGLREGIKKGLVTRIRAGKSKQSITIQAQKSVGVGSNFWQAKKFRHPVFGRTATRADWVFQQGQPYFYAPIFEGQATMRETIEAAVNRAVDSIPKS